MSDGASASGGQLRFKVTLQPPDLGPWLAGNSGVPGFTTLDSGEPGPHAALISLTHGNEFAGAIVLDRMLRAGVCPRRGRLTFGFANLAAFARFDRDAPTASRFVEEDLNRVWDRDVLDGPRRSVELDRAREMRPLLEEADALLDLHSMLWPSDPLILSGPALRGRALACAIGIPSLVVADRGHLTGPRLIDFAPFVEESGTRAACLVEAGQHWEPETVETAEACVRGLLRQLEMLDSAAFDGPVAEGAGTARDAAGTASDQPGAPGPPLPPARIAEVTLAVTAMTSSFAFLQPFRGGDVVARRNTLIAVDGTTEIRTPHDDCLLIMPSLRPTRGHTAVRLARFV